MRNIGSLYGPTHVVQHWPPNAPHCAVAGERCDFAVWRLAFGLQKRAMFAKVPEVSKSQTRWNICFVPNQAVRNWKRRYTCAHNRDFLSSTNCLHYKSQDTLTSQQQNSYTIHIRHQVITPHTSYLTYHYHGNDQQSLTPAIAITTTSNKQHSTTCADSSATSTPTAAVPTVTAACQRPTTAASTS